MIEEGYVADRQSQDLDLRELLVGRQRRQHVAQSAERRVERLDADPFARRVRRPVALCRPPVTTPLLPVAAAPASRRAAERRTAAAEAMRETAGG